MAVKGEANKLDFAGMHSGVPWTVLVPRFQIVFNKIGNILLLQRAGQFPFPALQAFILNINLRPCLHY